MASSTAVPRKCELLNGAAPQNRPPLHDTRRCEAGPLPGSAPATACGSRYPPFSPGPRGKALFTASSPSEQAALLQVEGDGSPAGDGQRLFISGSPE